LGGRRTARRRTPTPIQFAEIRLRAERRFGEINKHLDTAKGNQYSAPSPAGTKQAALDAVGVSKQNASRFESLAQIPEEEVEPIVASVGVGAEVD
jgi:hypothetical protein